MDPSRRLANMVPVVSYDEAAQLVLSKHVRQATEDEVEFMPWKKDILSTLNGSAHTARRRIENPLFARPNLLRFEHEVLDASLERQLLDVFSLATERAPVGADLIRISQLTLLPVTAAFLGLDADDESSWWESLSEFVRMSSIASALRWKEGDIEQERQECLNSIDEFDRRVFTVAYDRRLASVARTEHDATAREELPHDLITALLLHLPERPRDVILREVLLFFSAMTGTSAMAVATTIHHLDEWFEKHPEDRGKHNDLEFVQRAVFEAIRLNPIPGLMKAADQEVVLSTGRTIPAGREIFIDLVAVNRDPAIFGADADEFNPRRELAIGVRPYAFGFGGGAHKCIGRPLATSHDDHSDDAHLDYAVGSVVRIVRRLLELGVRIDPDNPPVFRTGARQKRYSRFPILFTAPLSSGRLSA